MNLQETIALIGALKEAGATHFKSGDFEITIGEYGNFIHDIQRRKHEEPKAPISESQEGPIDQEKTKKIEDVIDLLKMKDDQIIDRIFPDGAL